MTTFIQTEDMNLSDQHKQSQILFFSPDSVSELLISLHRRNLYCFDSGLLSVGFCFLAVVLASAADPKRTIYLEWDVLEVGPLQNWFRILNTAIPARICPRLRRLQKVPYSLWTSSHPLLAAPPLSTGGGVFFGGQCFSSRSGVCK